MPGLLLLSPAWERGFLVNVSPPLTSCTLGNKAQHRWPVVGGAVAPITPPLIMITLVKLQLKVLLRNFYSVAGKQPHLHLS